MIIFIKKTSSLLIASWWKSRLCVMCYIVLCDFVWNYSLKYMTLSVNILLRTLKLAPPDFSPAVCFAPEKVQLYALPLKSFFWRALWCPCRQAGASPACLGSSVSACRPQAHCTHKIYALPLAQRKEHSKPRTMVSSLCVLRPTCKYQVGTM